MAANNNNVHVFGLACIYLLLNIAFNVYSKYLFHHYQFNFPVLIMLFHQTGVVICLQALVVFGFVPRIPLADLRKVFLPCLVIGSLFGLNIIANNASLVYISLTLNQCVKATSPFFVMIFAYFLEKKTYSARLYFSSILTVLGVFFCASKNPSFDAVGILLCLSSTIFGSLQSSVSALLLESSPNLVLYVTMYNAIVVCFWCIPMVVTFELEYVVPPPYFQRIAFIGIQTNILLPLGYLFSCGNSLFHEYASTHSMKQCMLFLMLGLILALSYALVINKFIAVAGSVFFTLIGNLKFVIIIVLSFYIFHDTLTFVNIIGVSITFIGFVLYSYFKDKDKENTKEEVQELRETLSKDTKIHYDEFENVTEHESLLPRNADDIRAPLKASAESNKILVYLETFVCLFIIATIWAFLTSHKHDLPKAANIVTKAKAL